MASNEIKILEEIKNPLFKRKEVKLIISSLLTPNMEDSEKLISEKFSVPEENIQIKGINGKFGSNTFLISANVYSSKEDKEKIEPKQKEKKAKTG